jgi:hypothetical protein
VEQLGEAYGTVGTEAVERAVELIIGAFQLGPTFQDPARLGSRHGR